MSRLKAFAYGSHLPKGWRKSRLGEIGQIFSGSTPSRMGTSSFGGSIPWVKTGDLNNSIIEKTEETLTQEGLESSSCRLLPRQAVLVAMYGGFGQIGRTGLLAHASTTNQAISSIICDRSKAEPQFVLQWLNAYRFLWKDFAGSSRKDPNITKNDVQSFPIALPSLVEQRRMADVLCLWDEALKKMDALIEVKALQSNGLAQKLLVGKIRMPAFRARSWQAIRMADMLSRIFRPIEVGETDSLKLVSIRRRLGGLFLRPEVLASDYKTQDLHAIKTGDFLISKRQVVHGAWAIVEPQFDGALVSKEYAILVNRAPEVLDMRYFSWLAKTPRMLRLARVASTGVHIEKLIFDPTVFLEEKVRLPGDIKEQAAIAAVLDATDRELQLLRNKRTALEEQKRGLMQQLLIGKRRVSA